MLVRGERTVHEAIEALGTDRLEGAEFDSFAGLLVDRTARLVTEGESITEDGVRFVVEIVKNNRILEVGIELPVVETDSESEHTGPPDGEISRPPRPLNSRHSL